MLVVVRTALFELTERGERIGSACAAILLRACIAITNKPLACRTSFSLTRPTLSERLSGDDRRFLLLKRLHHGVIKLQVPPDQFRRCQRHPLVERDIGKYRTAEHLKKT